MRSCATTRARPKPGLTCQPRRPTMRGRRTPPESLAAAWSALSAVDALRWTGALRVGRAMPCTASDPCLYASHCPVHRRARLCCVHVPPLTWTVPIQHCGAHRNLQALGAKEQRAAPRRLRFAGAEADRGARIPGTAADHARPRGRPGSCEQKVGAGDAGADCAHARRKNIHTRTYTNIHELAGEASRAAPGPARRAAVQSRARVLSPRTQPRPLFSHALGRCSRGCGCAGIWGGRGVWQLPARCCLQDEASQVASPSPALALLQRTSAGANAERRLTKGVCFDMSCWASNSAGRVGLASGLGGRTSTFGGRGKDQLVRRKRRSSAC